MDIIIVNMLFLIILEILIIYIYIHNTLLKLY